MVSTAFFLLLLLFLRQQPGLSFSRSFYQSFHKNIFATTTTTKKQDKTSRNIVIMSSEVEKYGKFWEPTTIDLSECNDEESMHEVIGDLTGYTGNEKCVMFHGPPIVMVKGDAPTTELFHYFWKTLVADFSSYPDRVEEIKYILISNCIIKDEATMQAIADYSLQLRQHEDEHVRRMGQFVIGNSEVSFSALAYFVATLLDQDNKSVDILPTPFKEMSNLEFHNCKINNEFYFKIHIDSKATKQQNKVELKLSTSYYDENDKVLVKQFIQGLSPELQADASVQYLIQNTKNNLGSVVNN